MIWFFSRDAELTKYEIRSPSDGAYLLVVTRSNAAMDMETEVEAFGDPSQLIERALETQDGLRRDGWIPERVRIFPTPFAASLTA